MASLRGLDRQTRVDTFRDSNKVPFRMMGHILSHFSNVCILQLTDGRKSVGGKLEVKVRIRDPFKSKQVEEVKEKWLVIDQFIKTLTNSKSKTKQEVRHKSSCME